MSYNEGYNGWTNRETWLVNIHYNPETKTDLDYIREMLEEEEEKLPAFFRDFVDLSLINWEELAENMDDSEEEEGE